MRDRAKLCRTIVSHMRIIALSLLFYLVCQPPASGQTSVLTPRAIDPAAKVLVPAHWAGLFSVRIPTTCKHRKKMRNKQTCATFVTFSGVPLLKANRYRFRTWDEASEEDSSYRIFLSAPSWRGIFVRGVCGHRIFLEVTYQ